MQIERQTGSLGAYMSGVQLSELSSQRARSLVFEALNEHQVVCFQEQTITPQQHVALARGLGELYVLTRIAGKQGLLIHARHRRARLAAQRAGGRSELDHCP